MEETIEIIYGSANFTSAGTSQLSVKTSSGIEHASVENLSELDSDYDHSDLGRLYKESPENFANIQKITFRCQFFFSCCFSSGDVMNKLKFDAEGTLMDNIDF
jgi:hypothetical protein